MSKHIFWIIALISLTFAACSKEIPYNSNSGDNGSRDTAVAIQLDQDITDTLTASVGDNEDWFYFVPPEAGFVTMSVHLDNPGSLPLDIAIYDGFGRPLQNLTSTAQTDTYLLEKFDVTSNKYFVAFKTLKGNGDYTFRIDFTPPPVIIAPPEPVEAIQEVQPPAPSCVPADKCKPGQKCCKPKSNDKNTNTDNTPQPENDLANATTIKGKIVLNTPRGDGISEIKISGINNKNCKAGAKAVLKGLNRKVDIYKCMNTSCMATVKATSEELKKYDSVDVVVE